MSVLIGSFVQVAIDAPINKTKQMVAGETIDQVAQFFEFSFDDYIIVNKQMNEHMSKTTELSRNIQSCPKIFLGFCIKIIRVGDAKI